MNIEKVTPYPSRYADEPEAWELEALYAREEEEWKQQAAGKFWIRAELYWKKNLGVLLNAAERRNAAQVVSSALNKRAEFQRSEDCYKIEEWVLTNRSITSCFFDVENRAQCLNVFAALDQAGYRTNGELSIHYRPESFGLERLAALASLAEKELKQLKEKLELPEEPFIGLASGGLELYIPMQKLQYEALEECLLLFCRLIGMSELQCDESIAG